jgi:hypothetical protein
MLSNAVRGAKVQQPAALSFAEISANYGVTEQTGKSSRTKVRSGLPAARCLVLHTYLNKTLASNNVLIF